MKIEMSVDEFLRMIDNLRIDASEIEINTPPMNTIKQSVIDFHNIFNEISGSNKEDVPHNLLLEKLSRVGYSPSFAEQIIKDALKNGQIYERREGWYAKA